MADMVNHPPHYMKGGVECIDCIEAAVLGLAGTDAFLTGQVIKYMYRWHDKNGLEDLMKARWYLERLIGNVSLAGKLETKKNDERRMEGA